MEIMRATEEWQRTGAYYVRIQAMAKKHHITLRQEFDEHDAPGTKYIVIFDDDFPIATARMYQLDGKSVMIGIDIYYKFIGYVNMKEMLKNGVICQENTPDGPRLVRCRPAG